MELRPLTLLYGPNNVGKSALLRMLPLLHDSVAVGAAVPVVLSGPVGRGAAFPDLIWNGERASDEPPVLTLCLDWPPEDRVRRMEFEIHAVSSSQGAPVTPIIRSFSIWKDQGAPEWRAERVVSDADEPSREMVFDARFEGQKSRRVKLQFEGLVPMVRRAQLPGLKEAQEQLKAIRGRIQWLTVPRYFDDRLVPEPVGAGPGLLPPFGGRAILQELRRDPDLTEQVSAWYRKGGGVAATGAASREIRFESMPPGHFRALMAVPGTRALAVDIVDAGAGWAQLLPVLTTLALARRPDGPRIVAIEEPESNLHPSAQRAIAEAVVEVVRDQKDARIVLETHSFPLLQYIQLQIIKDRLRPEEVVAYWVYQTENGESRLTAGSFDREGRISADWPSSAFDESFNLAREIADARRERAR